MNLEEGLFLMSKVPLQVHAFLLGFDPDTCSVDLQEYLAQKKMPQPPKTTEGP